jgi:hypothetical protein
VVIGDRAAKERRAAILDPNSAAQRDLAALSNVTVNSAVLKVWATSGDPDPTPHRGSRVTNDRGLYDSSIAIDDSKSSATTA